MTPQRFHNQENLQSKLIDFLVPGLACFSYSKTTLKNSFFLTRQNKFDACFVRMLSSRII